MANKIKALRVDIFPSPTVDYCFRFEVTVRREAGLKAHTKFSLEYENDHFKTLFRALMERATREIEAAIANEEEDGKA